jgi:hypothetical protein
MTRESVPHRRLLTICIKCACVQLIRVEDERHCDQSIRLIDILWLVIIVVSGEVSSLIFFNFFC